MITDEVYVEIELLRKHGLIKAVRETHPTRCKEWLQLVDHVKQQLRLELAKPE
ncbi:MAG: hypothetical protein AABZ67_11900 [Pseudomonadota bacterium]